MGREHGFQLYGEKLSRRSSSASPSAKPAGEEGAEETSLGRSIRPERLRTAFPSVNANNLEQSKAEWSKLVGDLEAKQKEFETDRVKRTSDLLGGARSNLRRSEKDLADNSGVISWAMGLKKTLKKQCDTEAGFVADYEKQLSEQKSALSESQRLAKEAREQREEGLKLLQSAQSSDQRQQALKLLEKSELSFVEAYSALGKKDSVDLTAQMRKLRGLNEDYDTVITRCNNTETVARCVQKGLIITAAGAATAATGGLAGIALGVAYAGGATTLANGAELGSMAAHGQEVGWEQVKEKGIDVLCTTG
jgi:hypothetical protein